MKALVALLATLFAFSYASPISAQSTAFEVPAFSFAEDESDDEGVLGLESLNPVDVRLTAMVDVSLQLDSASAIVPGRKASADAASLALRMKGRAAYDLFETAGIFAELGVSLNFGGMDAYVEDARPTVSDDDLFGGLYGAGIEFGVGAYAGPFVASMGLTARQVSGLLFDDVYHYHDYDNDGFFEEDSFTLDYGYWASYLEAGVRFGSFGSFGGTGITLRYMPSVYFNFREGEDETWGWSIRGQLSFDVGMPESIGLFSEFGRLANESAGSEDIWWFQVGIAAYFG
ncbi:MAG: hypothetical protein KDB07_06705 [Planctomycetes bacterium]|nr:hypothetical protein [Planctomycetota bacterium]